VVEERLCALVVLADVDRVALAVRPERVLDDAVVVAAIAGKRLAEADHGLVVLRVEGHLTAEPDLVHRSLAQVGA
jgi:hypothetical protein